MILLVVYLAGAAALAALGYGAFAALLLSLLGVAVVVTTPEWLIRAAPRRLW